MIWAISGALALAGLVLLGVAALKLLGPLRELNAGLDRLKERAEQAQELSERLNATMADAERVAGSMPQK
ncbi:hypothetical protein L0U85_11855 [Glycomyces sp. L485]|uniref:hypothetical protein n=1 Tax=Glycomyces sp. L485 TaxID=2909235 RepID=UPI001F4ACD7B|nr:hypothetical protein [Glycomyces sp. L485]MCH7231538.1 hypothetical protein [Glycomyces sp. L485]